MKVCKQRTRDLDDLIDDPNGFEALVNDKEWAVLSQDEHSEESLQALKHKQWLKKQEDMLKKAAIENQKQSNQAAASKKDKKKKNKEAKQAAREKNRIERQAAKKAAASAGSADDEDADGDDYGDEYDDEYGDYDDEAQEDYGEEDGGNPGEIIVAANKEENKKPVFAGSKLTEAQKQADAELGEKYPKFAEAVKILD